MKIQSLFALGLFAVALLFFPAPTSAQGCYECELNECVDADWHGMGGEQCGTDGDGWCYLYGGACWGPGSGGFALAVRADGTLITPATGEANLTASTEFATAESAGLFAVARSYERNCKGLITRRVYGEAELAELARRTKLSLLARMPHPFSRPFPTPLGAWVSNGTWGRFSLVPPFWG